MNEMQPVGEDPSQSPPQEVRRPSVVKLSVRSRIVLWLYGFMMPLFCLAVSFSGFTGSLDQPWQSGSIDIYAAMLLRPLSWMWFTPWLLLSLISLTIWTYQPLTATRWWIRFGLYSGVILALQFWIIVLLQTYFLSPFIAAFVWPSIFVISLLLTGIGKHYKRFQIWHLLCLTTIVAVVAAVLQILPTGAAGALILVPMVILAAAPTLNLIAYVQAAVIVSRIDKRLDGKLLPMLIGWTFGWLLSWRLAVQAMLDQYSRLPVNDPNCYFANAAAHAHVCLGGSRRRLTPSGDDSASTATAEVTLAMKRLKFLELALMATAPRVHRSIRRFYDRWGEPAARFCANHGWFADLTCIALKPVEGLAEAVRVAAGISRAQMSAIYRSEKN